MNKEVNRRAFKLTYSNKARAYINVLKMVEINQQKFSPGKCSARERVGKKACKKINKNIGKCIPPTLENHPVINTEAKHRQQPSRVMNITTLQ